ncbi:unnamed protein product [Linum tenue]|uniref:Uncharacterized protein n=1 Tax=Linum tenue TaxID=586396 RepID=A0AAV0M7Z2_9ROSI|nr:unnamed protein product [Linum tenue]
MALYYSSTATPAGAGGILRSGAGKDYSLFTLSSASFSHSNDYSPTTCASLRASADSAPKARFVARRKESISVSQLGRPLSNVRISVCYFHFVSGIWVLLVLIEGFLALVGNFVAEYMSLPASQYSVLDAERIERVDDNTFRCYVYRFKFFNFEVCPVLLVKVEEQPYGCCINLLSCKLEGSPIVVAQNDKFDASMVNRISCDTNQSNSLVQQLTSDAVIEVSIEVPFAFRLLPAGAIESAGTGVLQQILGIMLPRFMQQLVKDYQAWASGDTSRQALGTGEI